jgi:hypothetical protein
MRCQIRALLVLHRKTPYWTDNREARVCPGLNCLSYCRGAPQTDPTLDYGKVKRLRCFLSGIKQMLLPYTQSKLAAWLMEPCETARTGNV